MTSGEDEGYRMTRDFERPSKVEADKPYTIEIKSLIKDNFVYFDSFRQNTFYYTINHWQEKGVHEDWYDNYDREEDKRYNTYLFPVPQDDIGTATLNSKDKAILFMRWIRKAISDKTFIKQ